VELTLYGVDLDNVILYFHSKYLTSIFYDDTHIANVY
jgi:hypothetical protein